MINLSRLWLQPACVNALELAFNPSRPHISSTISKTRVDPETTTIDSDNNAPPAAPNPFFKFTAPTADPSISNPFLFSCPAPPTVDLPPSPPLPPLASSPLPVPFAIARSMACRMRAFPDSSGRSGSVRMGLPGVASGRGGGARLKGVGAGGSGEGETCLVNK